MGHSAILNPRTVRRRGQALIMVTLALIAMCGLLGLAVDFGWAYYVKRTAQAAADAAALAASHERLRIAGTTNGPFPCIGGNCRVDYACTTTTSDPADNIDNACMYASQNGFLESGRQRVRITEGQNSIPPTVPGVNMLYWVTVRITESVPQLFSAVMGNPTATVSARATAGIYLGDTRGSIILLNRRNDTVQMPGNPTAGINISVQATNGNAQGTIGDCNLSTDAVCAGGGILMASTCAGGGDCTGYAGEALSGSRVRAPYTSIRGTGQITMSNNASWTATPASGGDMNGDEFLDPTRGKPQLPITPPAGDCRVPGGLLAPADPTQTLLLGPGNYYATARDNRTGQEYATGEPIRIQGNVRFTSGGSCLSAVSDVTGFGTHVMYGGVDLKQGGQASVGITFEPGQFVVAGAVPAQNGNAALLFDVSSGQITINGVGTNNAGNAFIFTDGQNPALASQVPILLQGRTAMFKQGKSGFQAGNNNNVNIDLSGLNASAANLPANLKPYESVLIWQDRRNSRVRYDGNGNYSCTDEGLENCTKTDNELNTDGVTTGSPELFIQASPNVILRGTIYQPRGGWARINGGGRMNSALQLITGALFVSGGGNVLLSPVTQALPQTIVGLVE